MLKGMTILLLFQFGGELFSYFLRLPIPGNVIGFVLLLLALLAGIVKLSQVREAAYLLLDNLALFFIPAGVGMMQYFGLIRQQWLPITVGIFVSTILVLLVTGKVAQAMQVKEEKQDGNTVE